MIQFTKLRDGRWGVRATAGEYLPPGQHVTAQRKDGTRSVVRLGSVFYVGGGLSLAELYDDKAGKPVNGPGETRRCWGCGFMFTFPFCRSHGGNWHDWHCGCKVGNTVTESNQCETRSHTPDYAI